jgi:hypothetical protein
VSTLLQRPLPKSTPTGIRLLGIDSKWENDDVVLDLSIKKWLSYREPRVIGRHLRWEEVREAQNIARRITALLLLEPELDANCQAVKANLYPWPLEDDDGLRQWEI